MLRQKLEAHVHPALAVFGSFLLLIGIGLFLLRLPFATASRSISWIDGLFTSASAVCVTGLVVVDTGSYFTRFGQATILVLIQLGGLGMMTLSVALYRWLGRSIPFKQRKILQELFSHTPRGDIYSLVFSILRYTFAIEGMGFVLLSLFFLRRLPVPQALWASFFHAISAFCNAGFSLFPSSLMEYRSSVYLNGVIASLIVLGGIGFPVLFEIENRVASGNRGKPSLHLKTVLATTGILIVFGSLVLGILEYPLKGESVSWKTHILFSIFQSITARTAGFNTVDIASLGDATLTFLVFLMFIGASPGSCGGGVKTTTLALLVESILSKIRAKSRVIIGKKCIPEETVSRSLSLVVLAITFISIVLFILLATNAQLVTPVTEERGRVLPFLFEAVSAFGTVGLSMGITSSFDTTGKAVLALLMVVGRVGVLTFSYMFIRTNGVSAIEYAEENIMIG